MPWWMWLAGGFVLLVAELATPSGFFILFFGIGAVLTGALAAVDLVTTPAGQWFTFTALSVVSLLLFRGKLQAMVEPQPRPPVDSLIGEVAFPSAAMAAGQVGRVMLRGSSWEARNDGASPLDVNQRCKVTRVSGLQLGVVAE